MAYSSGCRPYGFKRDDSAAAIHCLAYSEGAMSVGIEILGRTSYVRRFFDCDEGLAVSLEVVSKPEGEVALLDTEDRADEISSTSVAMEEAIEPLALSGLKCTLLSGMNLVCRSGLPHETLICEQSPIRHIDHRIPSKSKSSTKMIRTGGRRQA
jgi:hypothetical protein